MISKKIVLAVITALVIGVTPVALATQAYAQTTNTVQSNNPFEGLIQFLAQKFGLDQNQVKSAVSQFHQTNMQNREKARLDKLVSQGKITSNQEQAIINELSALRSKYNLDNLKSQTPEQRKQTMQNMQNELDSWAKSQGIDPSVLKPGFVKRGMRRGWLGKPTPTPTT